MALQQAARELLVYDADLSGIGDQRELEATGRGVILILGGDQRHVQNLSLRADQQLGRLDAGHGRTGGGALVDQLLRKGRHGVGAEVVVLGNREDISGQRQVVQRGHGLQRGRLGVPRTATAAGRFAKRAISLGRGEREVQEGTNREGIRLSTESHLEELQHTLLASSHEDMRTGGGGFGVAFSGALEDLCGVGFI